MSDNPLRRGHGSTYRPAHAATTIQPGGATWACGKCSKRYGNTLGRWKHRMWGFVCANCKPAKKGA